MTAAAAVLGVAVSLVVTVTAPAYAEVIEVTNTDDTGPGSLRAALARAADTPTDDQITFAPDVRGQIHLTSGQLDVAVGGSSGNLAIEGPGAESLTVDAGGQSRVLDVRPSAGDAVPTLLVSGLTLTGGQADAGGALRAVATDVTLAETVVSDNRAGYAGGGISVSGGILLVTDATITGNSVGEPYSTAAGGGIFFDGADAGAALTVRDSTISDNTAVSESRYTEAFVVEGEGGGIFADHVDVVGSRIVDNEAAVGGGGLDGESVVVTRSTIARNVAGADGGGIRVRDTTGPAPGLRLESSTVTDNRAENGGGLHLGSNARLELSLSTVADNLAVAGGGLHATTDVSLRGTVVAMNSGGDLAGDGSATLDRSLVRDPRGFPAVDAGGSIIGQDPLLGPLADHGGPTPTLLPATNSPAIDRGTAFGETTDQRGSPRPVGAGSDIGAVELTQAEQQMTLPQVRNTAAPTITGRVRVGRTLRTDGGSWEATEDVEVTLRYQWLRDGVPIAGATSPSYTLTATDFGRNLYGDDTRKRVSVRVTATAEDHRDGSMASDYTRYVRRGAATMSGRPRVKGRLEVGEVLRARPRAGAVSPRPESVFIAWHVGGDVVERARDKLRLKLRPRMRGDRVKVEFFYYPPDGYRLLVKVVKRRGRVR